MSSPLISFTVDPRGAEEKFRGKSDAIRDALIERTTAVNTALQAKIAGEKLQGELLKSHTNKLAGSVRAIPTIAGNDQITGGVQAGGGPAYYAKSLEDGSKPHVIEAKNALALRFFIDGKAILRRRVFHPGTKPYLFMKGTLEESRESIIASFQDAANEVTAE